MELLKKLNKVIIFSALAIVMVISSFPIYAGSTGKIKGKVTDAVTNEALIGVNVIVVEASGLANNQWIVLNTGGVFEGRELKTANTDVKITAAGEAEIFASDKVDINVKAGGDVYVYGNPKNVNKKTLAGGRVYIKD